MYFQIFLNYVSSQKCEKQGVLCTDDCSGIIACVESGADPIPLHTCDSTDPTLLCQLTEGVPTCDATACTGPTGGDGITISCGSVGELPHPTKCGETVRCAEVGDGIPPTEQCKCPSGSFIDIMRPSMPCRSGSCPRKPVVCDTPGKFGQIQEGGDFFYICKDEENVVVFVSDADATRSLMPDLRASISKQCSEVPPSEGSGGEDEGSGGGARRK